MPDDVAIAALFLRLLLPAPEAGLLVLEVGAGNCDDLGWLGASCDDLGWLWAGCDNLGWLWAGCDNLRCL